MISWSHHFLVRYVPLQPGDNWELGEDERGWRAIQYDFIPVSTDLAVVVGLIDVAQAESRNTGFLGSGAPLDYGGPLRPESAKAEHVAPPERGGF